MSARKHRRPQPCGFQYIYDGRELVAVLEHRAGGWHVIIGDQEIGVCADRVAALRLINTHAEDNRYGQTQVAAG
jgi:hypothetical protein